MGRPLGSKDRKPRKLTPLARLAGQLTPLDYMLKVMRDTRGKPARRDAMAIAAAPYMHSKLSTVETKGSIKVELPSLADVQAALKAMEAEV